MTAPSSPANRTLRLPAWAILIMLVAGLLSVAFAGGSFFTLVALVLLVVNIVGAFKYFGDEVKRIAAAHTGPVDKATLRKDAMNSFATPLWLVATLAIGCLWTGIAIVEFVGFLVGLVFVLIFLALLGVALYLGYKAAKKHGYLS